MNRYFGHIDKNGKLEVEFDENFFDCDVDIYVHPKISSEKTVGEIFVEKVAGILQGIDPDQAKYEYLTTKYK